MSRVEGSSNDSRAELVEMAYDHVMKGLGQQETKLNSLRQYAGTLAVLNGLVVAFVGKTALEKESTPLVENLVEPGAMIFLAISLFSIAAILWSTKNWVFHFSGADILQRLDDVEELGFSEIQKQLTEKAEEYWEKNDEKLKDKQSWLKTAVLFLFAHFLLWVIAL